jgi:hypothetical protein
MMNIRPINRIFPTMIDIINEIQVVKHIMHEKSFNKNLIKNDLEKYLLTNKYSI